MSLQNKYFGITIHDDSFFMIDNLPFKPGANNCALATLTKIEHVLRFNLTCEFTGKNSTDITTSLQDKALKIYQGYNENCSYLNGFKQLFFNDRVTEIYLKIKKFTNLPQELPNELIQKIAENLDLFDLPMFVRLNKFTNSLSSNFFLKHAQSLGYKGNNSIKGITYIKNLIFDITNTSYLGVIPSYPLFFVCPKSALSCFQGKSLSTLLWILQKKDIYKYSCYHFCHYLLLTIENHEDLLKNDSKKMCCEAYDKAIKIAKEWHPTLLNELLIGKKSFI